MHELACATVEYGREVGARNPPRSREVVAIR
jgi:hypothetical protein